MSAEGMRPNLDEMNIGGKLEMRRQHFTDISNPDDFGRAKNTPEVQNAAVTENKMVDHGMNDTDFRPHRNHGALADEIANNLAGPDFTKDAHRAAGHGAQAELYNIEGAQRAVAPARTKPAEQE
jgi:hypothetical protein